MTSVLRPHAPVAERVLLPGDPGRALRLAQQLIDGPKMLNHHRGLWGYSGAAADGALLTIQSTGLGGPSAAAVVADLIALGARRLVRVGTADAPRGGAAPGELVVAEAVLPGDGASRALGADGPARPPTPRSSARCAPRPARRCAPASSPRPTSSPSTTRRRGGPTSRRSTSPAPRCSPPRPVAGRRRRASWGSAACWATAAGSSPTRSRRSRLELGRIAAAALSGPPTRQ